MFIARPAAEIEPWERICSSKSILPGPIRPIPSRSIRTLKDGSEVVADFRMFGRFVLLVSPGKQSSDSEVRKLSRRPLMRTSESKDLQQLFGLSSGFEFEVPITHFAIPIGTSNSPH